MSLGNKGRVIISSTADPTQDSNAIEFAPQSMKPSIDSLATEDSGRSDDGVMRIYYVLDRIRKLEITLRPDTVENISAILNKVVGRFYYITFWDIAENRELTRRVYTSNGSADWYSGVLYNGLLQNASFNAIELGGEKNGVVING